jgi:beta-glucanase (GH16 family)
MAGETSGWHPSLPGDRQDDVSRSETHDDELVDAARGNAIPADIAERLRQRLLLGERGMIKLVSAIVILIALWMPNHSRGSENLPPETAPTNWPLTFSDNFRTFDQSHWTTKFNEGNRFLGGQGEEEIYVDPSYTGDRSAPLGLNPFSIKDGVLTIRADRPSLTLRPHLEGQLYTSGLVTTEHSFSQLYGYFEMRAKFPYGRGLWPAFWLLPTDMSWPPEIDVVEVVGDQAKTVYTTVHWGLKLKPQKIGFNPSVSDVTENFHLYGMMWSPTFVAWYFDGKRIAYTQTPSDTHKPMYLLINLAVGGDWPGQPDVSTKFPADMQINYVKAYALPPNGRE